MKIVQLEAENIKRIKAVRIDPKGNIIVIGGNNGQGKTSVLDSIMYALGGKRAVCERPLREGAKKGKVTVDLGEYLVTATFTKNNSSLTVKNKDGAQFPSPQALLDCLVGKLSFDPLEFSRMDSRKQLETVRALLGLDFAEEDAHRKEVYDERTELSRDLKNCKAQLESMRRHDGVAVVEDIGDLTKLYDEAMAKQTELAQLREKVTSAHRTIKNLGERRLEILSELGKIEERELNEQAILTDYIARGKKLAVEAVDPEPIRAKIKDASDNASKARDNQLYDDVTKRYVALSQQVEELTGEIGEIDQKKAETIANTKFPIDGMTFYDGGILLNGIPFSQASSAEQLRVSVAMGIAMNPKLKVILIRDGSLLDDENLAMIASMAAESDSQVWIEKVGKGKECSVIIEDGEVANE